MPILAQLTEAIEASWAADTTFDASEWSPENPARGQCVATSLVVQHFLGGELQKLTTIFEGQPETHYRNVFTDGTVVDLTCRQYPADQPLTPAIVDLKSFPSIREKRLNELVTKRKYELLLARVIKGLSA